MNERLTSGVAILCLVLLYFWGNGALSVTAPVEVNYAQTAKEMLAAGDYLSPQIYGNYWYDKPIFFYWELIAAFSVFGVTDFAARFFPALFAAAGLVLTYAFARRLYDERTAFWSTIILGTGVLYSVLAKLILTDMSLFVFFGGTLAAFFIGYYEQRTHYFYIAYACAGLAVLTKGPIGLLLPGLVILVFLAAARDLSALRRICIPTGLLVFAAVCAPWYVYMYFAHGADFVNTFLGIHNVLRATVSEHAKWDVWYFYLGIYFLGMFPWSFALPLGIWRAWRVRPVIETRTLFLLVWAIVVPVFFQFMATKYPTYSFPAFLPTAILTARLLAKNPRVLKAGAILGMGLYLAVVFVVTNYSERDGHFSGKGAATILTQTMKPDDLLACYGDYTATVPYYTGHTMYALATREEIAARAPKEMSWNSKNVMPFLPIDELPRDRTVYLVVERHALDAFEENFADAGFEQLGTLPTEGREKLRIYRRAGFAQ
ncbi:dolichyl-phosphate-mannose-protein mannosyltransferase [Selenomonas sp. FOBRC6]|uniref:ArnT family glycosyltransferase n=1 Tax=Selenomonas sp. FOBRC6 TaxID=936572 RepID=UPI00027819CE|nr:glycosyltransferase family 39 protein [Selenomonas sp. FOBRC6]EJO22489.1 dolichyl-phosphate-mannose-protein mannosyltransferase [Selenomonas sp. FOBRC6]